jgi:hypothetical protein
LNNFNLHGLNLTNGDPTAENNKIWGFTEDKATGYTDDNSFTADGVRVEAWEFLMNGGGLYDHLSYAWGNPSNNEGQSNRARDLLGYLGKFMDTLNLDDMKRLMPAKTDGWILNPPAYGPNENSPFWAAMSRPRSGTDASKYETFLFYAHRSRLSGPRYLAFTGTQKKTISITVQKLGATGCYQADWYFPSGTTPTGGSALQGGALKSMRTDKFQLQTLTQTKLLTSPDYLQDILMKITFVKTGACSAN